MSSAHKTLDWHLLFLKNPGNICQMSENRKQNPVTEFNHCYTSNSCKKYAFHEGIFLHKQLLEVLSRNKYKVLRCNLFLYQKLPFLSQLFFFFFKCIKWGRFMNKMAKSIYAMHQDDQLQPWVCRNYSHHWCWQTTLFPHKTPVPRSRNTGVRCSSSGYRCAL